MMQVEKLRCWSEEKIRKTLKQVEEELKCQCCGSIKPEIYYDGDMRCSNCGCILNGTWFEYGVWMTLRWLLGEISDEEFYNEIK